ncbi:MAG: hypothetical protein H0X66_19020 [Verrucomicrobia bacterium]|nr:hypothetical protein [Verrucomicrobiota bacterium]
MKLKPFLLNTRALARTTSALFSLTFLICAASVLAQAPSVNDLQKNLAPSARVSASSEYSPAYPAKMAVTGVIPSEFQQEGNEWAVLGTQSGWFELQWDEAVEAGQMIYFARTKTPLLECFKDYQVFVNEDPAPVARGKLEHRRGPQRIDFPRQRVRKLRIEFLTSYPDSPNPGAAEIAVYRSPVSEVQLAEMLTPPEENTPAALALRRDLMTGRLGFRDMLLVHRKPLDLSHVYVYHVEGFRPGGGLYIFTPDEKGGQLKCIFEAGEGMITTADLSYDGREIVFALRRGGHIASSPISHIEDISQYAEEKNNYQIFRINIDGTGLKQLTRGAHNNLDPCWLPDGGIAFMSDRRPAYAYCWVTTSPVLYRMDGDGSSQKRLSANYLMDFTPSVLNDGRIIYSRWEYVDRPACPIQSLWTINPDGTGLAGFYGNRVLTPGTFMDARAIPGSDAVIATAANHNGSCRGGIVTIDPSKGVNAREAVRNLTPEIDIYAHIIGGGPFGNGMLDSGIHGSYEKPMPIDAQRFLVSKGGVIQLRDLDANAASLLAPRDGMGFYSPQPIRARPLPPVLAGNVRDRTAELPEDGSVSGRWATLLLQDVYVGLEPDVKRGEIKQIAVVQEVEKSTHSPMTHNRPDGPGTRTIAAFGFQFPLVSAGATYAPKKVWGLADVAPDGSAAFRVPSEVPIYFLALDGEGRAVQRMRTFTHLMPGEIQSCVGCHSDRNSVSPRREKYLTKAAAPQELHAPSWGVKGFSYPEVVQPVLDRNCTQCHNEREQPGGVDLTGDMTDFFNVSYDILCRTGTQGEKNWNRHNTPSGAQYNNVRGKSPYVEWIWTINGAEENILEIEPRRWGSPASKLAEIIRSGHPDKEGRPQVDVPDEDRRRVYLWMDLNVPYYGTSSSNHKSEIGSRRMMPQNLDTTLNQVVASRCISCHTQGIPRKFYTRVTNPEKNNFLLAPLATEAGGTQRCSEPVFVSTDDPDYQKILRTFDPIHALLKRSPRADMANFE